MDDGAIPFSLETAYRFLNADRAWVACIPCEGCEASDEAHVHTLASKATRLELAHTPGAWPFLDSRCPKIERFKFLMGGIDTLIAEAMPEPA